MRSAAATASSNNPLWRRSHPGSSLSGSESAYGFHHLNHQHPHHPHHVHHHHLPHPHHGLHARIYPASYHYLSTLAVSGRIFITDAYSSDKKQLRVFDKSYREVHLLADLGWVDFDCGCSTFCLVLLGLMGSWQNWPCGSARWWNIPNLSQLNPVRQEMDLPVEPVLLNLAPLRDLGPTFLTGQLMRFPFWRRTS